MAAEALLEVIQRLVQLGEGGGQLELILRLHRRGEGVLGGAEPALELRAPRHRGEDGVDERQVGEGGDVLRQVPDPRAAAEDELARVRRRAARRGCA